MSDANYIASLLGLKVTGNTLGTGGLSLGEINILALPPDLHNLEAMKTLEGKILSVKQDGQVMISTEHGNITLLTDSPGRLQNKQDIEIRIDAGTPPTKAVLRPSPRAAEEHSTLDGQRFDAKTVETQLTQEAYALKAGTLDARQLLSGMALRMASFSAEETIARPFMKQQEAMLTSLSTQPLQVDQTGVVVTEGAISKSSPALLTNSKSGDTTSAEAQALADKTTLNAHNNAMALPFRTIAARLIGTSDETRILYKPASSASGDMTTKSSDYSSARQAEINVHNISSPQVEFVGSTPAKAHNTVHGIHNPHYAHDHLLSGTTLSSQIGLAKGVVEGFTQTRGFPVLRMLTPETVSGRLYALDVAVQDLSMGSQLEISMKTLNGGKENSEVAASIASAIHDPSLLMPGKWPVIEEVQQSLAQTGMQTAQAFNAALPSPSLPTQFGAGVLFFVAALRSGDVQSWLGEKAVDTLKRAGKTSLLGRLGRELSGLGQMNKEPVSGEWRALSIPLVWENNIQKVVIYTSHEDEAFDEDDARGKGGKTRFIVDLSLSNIGPVQLDGLFSGSHGEAPGKASGRLDLVLRTEQSFSQASKQQMRGAYKTALDDTQITGELSFQDHTLDWVRITPGEAREYSTNV